MAPSTPTTKKEGHSGWVVPPRKVDLTTSFFLGGISGCIGATCVYPLDMIKTRLQNQVGQAYAGVVDCGKKIIRAEGVRGLYKGLPAQLVGIAPEKAIKLGINDAIQRFFKRMNGTDHCTNPQLAIAGATAGFSQFVVTSPYELVKINIQVQGTLKPEQRKSMFTIIRDIGLKGMFRGASATLLRDVPFSALYFTLYSNLKQKLAYEDGTIAMSNQLFAGTIAGVISSSFVTPADVIKTRLQAGAKMGIAECFTSIVKNEGVPALYKGVVPRILIISPLFGITLFCYEIFVGLLGV